MININKLGPMANSLINNNINKYKLWLLYIILYDNNCVVLNNNSI